MIMSQGSFCLQCATITCSNGTAPQGHAVALFYEYWLCRQVFGNLNTKDRVHGRVILRITKFIMIITNNTNNNSSINKGITILSAPVFSRHVLCGELTDAVDRQPENKPSWNGPFRVKGLRSHNSDKPGEVHGAKSG